MNLFWLDFPDLVQESVIQDPRFEVINKSVILNLEIILHHNLYNEIVLFVPLNLEFYDMLSSINHGTKMSYAVYIIVLWAEIK